MFIDYNQNAKDRTVASAYSVRPTPDARVAAPVSWDELDGIQQRAVRRGLVRRAAEPIVRVGVDETSFQRRHEYVTVVSDLERRVGQRPPRGASTAARVVSVLRRATKALESEPRLSLAA